MATRLAPALAVDLAGAIDSYLLNRDIRPATEAIYRRELAVFDRYLASQGMPRTLTGIRREHIEAYLSDLRDRGLKPASVSMSFRVLRTFWRWAVDADEVTVSPMAKMHAPRVPVIPKAVLTDEEVAALLRACPSNTFEGRRDAAIIGLMFDTGMRRGELANLDVASVDLRLGVITGVWGKAERPRNVTLTKAAAEAIDRYLRLRSRHPRRADPALFLGTHGRLTGTGILQMFTRRGRAAGVKVHPHQLRHTFADRVKASGMSEEAAMTVAGWSTPEMLRRYGAARATERAMTEHRAHSPLGALLAKAGKGR